MEGYIFFFIFFPTYKAQEVWTSIHNNLISGHVFHEIFFSNVYFFLCDFFNKSSNLNIEPFLNTDTS